MTRAEAKTVPVTGPRWRALLWLAGPALVLIGLSVHGVWRQLPWERFALSLALAIVASLAAWPLVRWARWTWASALVVVWCVALLAYAGPLPVLGTSLIAAGALALGLLWIPDRTPGRAAIAAVSGYAVIAGLAGWLVSVRIHFPAVWLVLLAAPIFFNRRALHAQVVTCRHEWRELVEAAPIGAAAAVMLLGLASTGAWLPTMQMDDLTYHLNLPAQLAREAHYLADPERSIWSYAPWMGDIGHGLAWLLAGRESRGAFNTFWLVSAAMALAAGARALGATPVERIAVVALFASFPPLVWLMAGMQTELPAMAVLFALAALMLHDREMRYPVAASVLLAALAALKSMHLFAALPLLFYMLSRTRAVVRRLPMMLIAFVFVAGASYAHAAWHTGNPVFPLFNGIFQSAYAPIENTSDMRWDSGFGPLLLWNMTFLSSRYVEAWDGGIGFMLVGLAGAWLLALGRSTTRLIACIALCVALLPLLPLQYARYAYPGLLLLLLPALSGSRASVRQPRLWLWPIVLLCGLNLAFQANAGWTHHSAAIKRAIRAPGAQETVLPHYVAERTLLARHNDDTGLVLATDPERGHVAELGRRGLQMSAHAPSLMAMREAADLDASGAEWREVFTRLDVRWILVNEASASPALIRALAEDPGTERVDSLQDIELWSRKAP